MRAKILQRIDSLKSAKNPAERFAFLINEAGVMPKSEALQVLQDTQENLDSLTEKLSSSGKIVIADNNIMSENYCGEIMNALKESVKQYQSHYPAEKGMPLEDANVSRSVINLAVERGIIAMTEGKLHTPDFVPENDEAFTANIEAVRNFCMSRKWQLPTLDELRKELSLPERVFTKIIQAMRNDSSLALIPEGCVLIRELEDEMRSLLRGLGNQVTLAQVRDATGSTRKYILPILEYFDSKGFTRRAGDYRVVL